MRTKLWDCWVYPDEDLQHGELLPPDEMDAANPPHEAPAGLTLDQVAARLLETELADWGSLLHPDGRINLVVAIREHGSGRPFRLFRAQLLALRAEEVAWPVEDRDKSPFCPSLSLSNRAKEVA